MKKKLAHVGIAISALFALTMVLGCTNNSSTVPVSGVVTIDGEPVSGLRVTFWPEPTSDNAAPGPYSTGITDENGKYSLVYRYENPGAMVWKHRVTFEYDDVDPEAMSNAKDVAEDAKAAGVEMTAEEKALAGQAKAQMNKHVRIPKKYSDDGSEQFLIVVPPGGTDSADLVMVSK